MVYYEDYVKYFNDVPDFVIDYYNKYVFTEMDIFKPLLNYMICEWLTYAFRTHNQLAINIYMFGWDEYGHHMFNDNVCDSLYIFYTDVINYKYMFGENYRPSFILNLKCEI